MLLPDLLEQLDLRQLAHGLRRLRLLAGLQQPQPIAAHLLAQFGTLTFRGWRKRASSKRWT